MSADKANEDNVTREEQEEADKLDTSTAANNPEDESSQDDGSIHDNNEDVDGTIRRRVSIQVVFGLYKRVLNKMAQKV
jgi:hypothetical protein